VTNLTQSAAHLETWKLTLSYDGTDFRGWQVQPGEATVQGELQAALGRVTGESPLPQGSGRTDAGVHALAQVASFALQAPIPAENLMRALNRTLPASIRVLEARTVRSTFHARHSAVAKTYEYRVFREALCPPFLARYVLVCPWPMDVELLQRSAGLFEGEHDFRSFAATDPDMTGRSLDAAATVETRPMPRADFQVEPPTGKSSSARLALCWSIASGEMASCTTWSATWWAPCLTWAAASSIWRTFPGSSPPARAPLPAQRRLREGYFCIRWSTRTPKSLQRITDLLNHRANSGN